ncbi:MAG: hypothetical protein RLZZ136_1852 [Pseudomonadota bacterium]|jgi:hypothetical protein
MQTSGFILWLLLRVRAHVSKKQIVGLVTLIILVVAYAWVKGGREPVREITQDLPLPSTAK